MKKYKKFTKAIALNLVISLLLINSANVKVFAEEDTQQLLKVGKQIIKEYYIEPISVLKLDEAKDMNSLVELLNDPYSEYFTAQEYKEFTDSINNIFVGIGIQIEPSNEGIKIIKIFDNASAQRSGLKVGDIIIEADGHVLAGISADEAVTYIKGTAGSYVNLKVKRSQDTLEFKVIREDIVQPTVLGDLMDKHIAYIQIGSFGENTSTEFKNALNSFKDTADSYIIDLRFNPGGYINAAIDIAGHFIGETKVLNVQDKYLQTVSYNATKQDILIDKPVIFLINEYSASASEILSAAVKDNKKAVFIGEKTYGKGVGQSLFVLPYNNYLKLTTFKFVSPLGNEINKVGISPDIKIKDNFQYEIDSLNTARVLLNNSKVNALETGFVDKLYAIAYSAASNAMNIKSQKAINEARLAITALKGTDASFAVGEFSKQVDKVQHPFLVSIVDAINKAQKTMKQVDINAAKAAIDPELPEVWRNSYSSAIDTIQQGLMSKLVDASNRGDKEAVKALLEELKLSSNISIGVWADEITKNVLN